MNFNKYSLEEYSIAQTKLIDKVKLENRYADWIKFGANYGIEYLVLPSNKKLFVYNNIDNKEVYVEQVFGSDQFNKYYSKNNNIILVFDFVRSQSNGLVDVDECVIVDIETTLFTSGLLTCTGFGLKNSTHKLLAHITPSSKTGPILYKINNIFNKDNISQIYIWKGQEMIYSFDIVLNILNILGIKSNDLRIIIIQVESFMNKVNI